MIAIIEGGHESEAEVSRVTSQAFQKALTELGENFVVLDYNESLIEGLKASKPRLCLLAMHGTYGEDGVVQGLLEHLRIPYSGSGVFASSLSFDKWRSLQFAKFYGVNILPSFVLEKGQKLSEADLQVVSSWGGYVVKPSQSGSSRGVSLCEALPEMDEALMEAHKWSSEAVVEKKLSGCELAVSVLNGEVFEPIEIRPKTGFYDMKNKYTEGATDYLVPAEISESLKKQVQEAALKVFKNFGLRTYARVDFLASKENDEAYFMEVNTLPGCTPTSLFPRALKHSGVSFKSLIEDLIKGADLES